MQASPTPYLSSVQAQGEALLGTCSDHTCMAHHVHTAASPSTTNPRMTWHPLCLALRFQGAGLQGMGRSLERTHP